MFSSYPKNARCLQVFTCSNGMLDEALVVGGKMQKPLPELLKEYDMAVGIFPRDATNYEFTEATGKLIVYIPAVCEVGYKDSSVLRFSTVVSGYLEKGKLTDIDGIKTKVMIWVKVTAISSDGSKLHFTAGLLHCKDEDLLNQTINVSSCGS
ncbi:uncharacterized protein CFP56_012031 [Quercus suber]|uniref:DUF538 domain-containing protein n=1 Tax=Quercus suber TaxID=58331 RepID=A0AAW0KXZ0_QUESU